MTKKKGKTEKERITIMADPDLHAEIIKILKWRGVTREGLRLMQAGLMLDRAGLIDPINYITGVHKDKSDIDVLQMAIKISNVVSLDSEAPARTDVKTEKTDQKKPLASPFSAGRRS